MITLLQPVYDYSLHNLIVTATIESEPAGSHCCVTIWWRPARYAISTNHPSRLLAAGNECVRATCIVLLNSPLCHLSLSARGVLSLLMMGDVKSDSLLLKGGWGCNPPPPPPTSALISASGDWWQVPPTSWSGKRQAIDVIVVMGIWRWNRTLTGIVTVLYGII